MKILFASIAALVLGVFTAVAADVPVIRTVTPSAGSVTFTNSALGAGLLTINRILVDAIQPNDATVTVSRISTVKNLLSTNTVTRTNQLLTLICTSAAGQSSNITRTIYAGDKLVFSGVGTNAGNVLIEGLLSP